MKPLKTPLGIMLHLVVVLIMVASCGALMVVWVYKYRQVGRKKQDLRQAGSLLVLGKRCKDLHPDDDLKARLHTTAELCKEHTWKRIVFSGGGKQQYPEAQVMREHFESLEDIILETQSMDTIDNLAFSKPLLEQHVTIVSSDYHARRIDVLAKSFFDHYTLVGAPAPTKWYTHVLECLYAGWLEVALFVTPRMHHGKLLGIQENQNTQQRS